MERILIVEDEAMILTTLKEILELSQYDVFSASNGKEGIAKAKETQPDLIICDVNMPVMNGFEMLTALAGIEGFDAAPPVIFLSADASEQKRKTGLALGAAAFMTKPFFAKELLEEVRRVIA